MGKENQTKRFAVMTEKQGDLELKILGNKEDLNEFNEALEKNNKKPELYFEVPTQKTPYEIISEFKKYVPEKGLIRPPTSKDGAASILYIGKGDEDKFSFKESFLYYMGKYNQKLNSY